MKHLRLVLLIGLMIAAFGSIGLKYVKFVHAGDGDKKVEEEYKPLELSGKEAVEKFWECINNEKKIADKLTLPINTYKISKKVNVDKTGTMIIAAGSKFLFSNNAGIECWGKLIAKGTKEKSITFTADENSTWTNICIFGQKTKGTAFEFCHISKGSGYRFNIEDSESTESYGGGVLINSAFADFKNCKIDFNKASSGAGIGVHFSTVVIRDCQITENEIGEDVEDENIVELGSRGAGIESYESTINISGCEIKNNIAKYGAYCGGIWAKNCKLTLVDTTSINKNYCYPFGQDFFIIYRDKNIDNFILKNLKYDTKTQEAFKLITSDKTVRKSNSKDNRLQTQPNLNNKNNEMLQTQPQTQPQLQIQPEVDEELLKESEKKFWDYVNNRKTINETLILPVKSYEINNDVRINNEGVLKLLPGTKLLFSKYTGITCQGTIDALGTKDKPIEFTSQKKHLWSGISFRDKESINSRLIYCSISKSVSGLVCKDNANVVLKNCIIEKNKAVLQTGLSVIDASALIENCRIQFNESKKISGLYFSNAKSIVRNTYIGDNLAKDHGGLFIENSKDVEFESCKIENNSSEDLGNIIINNSKVVFKNCLIQKNSMGRDKEVKWGFGLIYYGGGQFSLYQSEIEFVSTTITNNISKWSDPSNGIALIANWDSNILIKDSMIYNNVRTGDLRRIFIGFYNSDLEKIDITIENSILDDNDQCENEFIFKD